MGTPGIVIVPSGFRPHQEDLPPALHVFMHFFPMMWFFEVLLQATSAGVVNTDTTAVTFGKLPRFLGIRLLMSTCSGWNVDQF